MAEHPTDGATAPSEGRAGRSGAPDDRRVVAYARWVIRWRWLL